MAEDKIKEYTEQLSEKGYPETVIKDAVRMIHIFNKIYKDDLSDKNILTFDKKHIRIYEGSNPALMLTMFRDWIDYNKEPAAHKRKRGIKDGFTRPKSCGRSSCRYITDTYCRYKPATDLNYVLTWKKCPYYECASVLDQEKGEQPVYHDNLYNRLADYKDSHSARWVE